MVIERLIEHLLPAMLIAMLVSIAGCPRDSSTRGGARTSGKTVTVFAAASLTEAFTELGGKFEAANPQTKVVFNFAGSPQLRAQLQQGAQADVFAPASRKEMQAATAASLVAPEAERIFARNKLVVICSRKRPGKVAALADLARGGLRLVIADPSVPVGAYTQEMLERLSTDAYFGADFKTRVLAGVVSREQNVKFVVMKVRLGEADAGVVYASDVTEQAAGEVSSIPIPDAANPIAEYPIAPLLRAAEPELAMKFVDLALAPEGQQVLARHGFLPARSGNP